MQRLPGLQQVEVLEHIESERRRRVKGKTLDGFAKRPVAREWARYSQIASASGAHNDAVAYGRFLRDGGARDRFTAFERLGTQLPFARRSQTVGGAGQGGTGSQARARAGENLLLDFQLEAPG